MPRLQIPAGPDEDELRERAQELFCSYAKRNAVSQYIQSHGPIGAHIVREVHRSGLRLSREINFWVYSQLLEAVLPLGYFCLILEPQLLVRTFSCLLEILDPEAAAVLGEVPELVFQKHFTNLFSELRNQAISL